MNNLHFSGFVIAKILVFNSKIKNEGWMGVSTARPTINNKKQLNLPHPRWEKKKKKKNLFLTEDKMKRVTLPCSLMEKYLHNLISESR